VVGAFLLWGPIGIGSGPLGVGIGATVGESDVSQTPVGFIVPMYNPGGSAAVVDSVDLVGGTRYPTPRILALGVLSSSACGSPFPARATSSGFVMVGCGGRYRGPLIGRSIGQTQRISSGFPAAAEAAAPQPGTCWVLTKVIVHYHVGIRHYTTAGPFEIVVCAAGATAQENAAMKAAEGIG
jgi:hypothetical protein